VTAAVVAASCVVIGLSTGSATADDHAVATATPTGTAAQIAAASGVRPQEVEGAFGVAAKDHSASAITYVYAGDSITARPDSWLHVLASDTSLEAVGGYAHSGYRSDQVLAEIHPGPTADVLVIELGTNDVNQARDLDQVVTNIDAVAARVDARHVLLTAAPPASNDWSQWGANRRVDGAKLNRLLAIDAERHGWLYFDPYAAYRQPDNAWAPGTSDDGIHPTAEANRTIARWYALGIEQADAAAKS
jgi:lysophospholipase L1-like esterase